MRGMRHPDSYPRFYRRRAEAGVARRDLPDAGLPAKGDPLPSDRGPGGISDSLRGAGRGYGQPVESQRLFEDARKPGWRRDLPDAGLPAKGDPLPSDRGPAGDIRLPPWGRPRLRAACRKPAAFQKTRGRGGGAKSAPGGGSASQMEICFSDRGTCGGYQTPSVGPAAAMGNLPETTGDARAGGIAGPAAEADATVFNCRCGRTPLPGPSDCRPIAAFPRKVEDFTGVPVTLADVVADRSRSSRDSGPPRRPPKR